MNLSSRLRSTLILLIAGLVLVVGAARLYTQAVGSGAWSANFGVQREDLSPGDVAYLEGLEATEIAAMTAIPTAPKDLPTLEPVPDVAWPSGIIESGLAPLPGEFYSIQNRWQDLIGDNHIQVYAGIRREDPLQGLVLVSMTPLDPTLASEGVWYLTPYKCGPVRIALEERDEGGIKLLLVSTTLPSWFRFNVTSRAWENFGIVISGGGPDRYVRVTPPCASVPPVPPVSTPTLMQPPGTPPAPAP